MIAQLPLGELRDEDLASKLIKAAGEGDCDGVWKIMSELSKRGCRLNNQDEVLQCALHISINFVVLSCHLCV